MVQVIARKSLGGLRRHIGGRWRSLCARGLLIFLCAILPLAEASPPDPLWLRGMYDGADLDDVVAAVIAATAVVVRTGLLLGPTVIVAKAPLLADRASLPRPSLRARPVRAPPSFTRSAA